MCKCENVQMCKWSPSLAAFVLIKLTKPIKLIKLTKLIKQHNTMNKKSLFAALLTLAATTFTSVSCSENDDPTPGGGGDDAAEVDYTSENADAWGNYMMNTARLLTSDAQKLYTNWAEKYGDNDKSYAELFKAHDNASGYGDVDQAIQEMVEKMGEIANEVGSSKIGDPYAKWVAGQQTQALYAVESWYSWHSRDDYTNNIKSIRNAYYGTRDGQIAENSLAKALEGTAIDTKVRQYITDAENAIQAIVQPFRNHIGSVEAQNAMTACEKLQKVLGEIETDEGAVEGDATNLKTEAIKLPEATKNAIINNFVDNVVVPTYRDLVTKNNALKVAVDAFAANPSNAGFEACCTAWLEAREPWETSEAFLFGPVDEFGLDPNMDSWPLDQNGIMQIMKSKKWSDLEWIDGDDDAKVESAQNVRGFHTLEFLIFKNGQPRTLPATK